MCWAYGRYTGWPAHGAVWLPVFSVRKPLVALAGKFCFPTGRHAGRLRFCARSGFIVYGGLKAFMGIRMSEEEEQAGADLSIHKIAARPEAGISR